MHLNNEELKQKANFLLSYFELYHFKNKLDYSRNINLLFEFCDYVNQMPDWELLEKIESSQESDILKFRNMINQGIDYWLNDTLKTISF